MSTNLELCQDAARECGLDRTGVLPTAVTNQVGELLDIVSWLKDGWVELQNRHEWRWMRRTFTLVTDLHLSYTSGGGAYTPAVGDTLTGVTSAATAVITRIIVDSGTMAAGTAAGHFVFTTQTGTFEAENLDVGANANVATIAGDSARTGIYTYKDCTDDTAAAAITRFKRWRFQDRQDPPKIYLTSSGTGNEVWMTWVPWEHFKSLYLRGNQSNAYPAYISVDPTNRIHLGPVPNASYTITADYHLSAQVMTADADIPELPTDFHKLLVYATMQKYAGTESAQEVADRAILEGGPVLRQLERDQLPRPRKARPLA